MGCELHETRNEVDEARNPRLQAALILWPSLDTAVSVDVAQIVMISYHMMCSAQRISRIVVFITKHVTLGTYNIREMYLVHNSGG